MAVLKVLQGGPAGQLLELLGERIVLGRHPQCQIVLDNAAVSRQHAQILENHGAYYLEDLRSRNGTQVNGEPIRGRVQLSNGDQLKLCDYAFEFVVPAGSARDAQRRSSGDKPRPLGTRSRSRETIDSSDEEIARLISRAPVNLGGGGDFSDDNGSSVVTMLEATGTGVVRYNIRPEVKLKAVLDISTALSGSLKLDEVLPTILKSLFRIYPQAEWGFVLLREGDGDQLSVRVTRSRDPDEENPVPVSMTIVRQAMNSGQAILTADARGDARFDTSESLSDLQIRSVMCAPLAVGAGKSLGVIQISTRDISQQFSPDDLDLLVSVASQASLAVDHARLHESLLHQRDLERDLEFATQVQLGFLPSHPPKLPGFELADYYEPAYRVGGDYFDYVAFPDGRVAVAVGDVAGKGLPAALLMARLHAAARYQLLSRQSAGAALEGLNSELATSGVGFRFVTLILAVIDPLHHTVQIASAGHLPAVWRRTHGDVECVCLKESGMPLGIVPQQCFTEVTIRIEPGESLVFYTDGVSEAMNAENELYGRARLATVIASQAGSSTALVNAIVTDVEQFCGESPQRDDLCVVALHRRADDGRSTAEAKTVPLRQVPEEI